MAPPGWHSTAQPCSRSRWNWLATIRLRKTWRRSSSSISWRLPMPLTPSAAPDLWDEQDGFYYDHLQVDGTTFPLKVRSLVGLIPLLAVEVLDYTLIQKLPGFKKRMDWFLHNRPDLMNSVPTAPPARPIPARAGACWPFPRASGCSASCGMSWTKMSFSLRTVFALSRACTGTGLTFFIWTDTNIGSITSRASPAPGCLAAIQIGADRFGFRSITC